VLIGDFGNDKLFGDTGSAVNCERSG